MEIEDSKWSYFIWLALRDRLPTNSLRHCWGMDGNGACKQCPREMETVIHVLRDCRVSRDIWNSLRSDLQDTDFLFLLVRECLKEHMSLKMATGKLCLL